MQEMNLAQETWDKKKIIIGIVSLFAVVGGGLAAKTLVLDKNQVSNPPSSVGSSQNVQGISTTNPDAFTPTPIPQPITLPSATDLSKKVEEIKQEITHLNANDIATSSPAVQNVLNQLKDLPQSQIKDTCLKICNGL